MTFSVDKDGTITAIYHDDLRPLLDEGTATTERVSDVEPTADGRGWVARMRDGVRLPAQRLRQDALDAEVAYLTARLFT